MASLRKSYQHIEHASTCPCVIDAQEDCNCFYSALSKTDVFEAATLEGPSHDKGHMDDVALGHIREFVAHKQSQSRQRTAPHSSSQLYRPLGQGEIRVLELCAGEFEAPLHANLHAVSIDFSHPPREQQLTYHLDDPANTSRRTFTWTRHTNHAVSLATGNPVWYTALSYCWGAPVFDQAIRIDNDSLQISQSLAGALRHLRLAEKSVFVWTDQICINQQDLAEKGQQIPLMGMIYTHATNTLIWLGDVDGDDPARAFDLMETVYTRLQGIDAQVTAADFGRLDFPPALDQAWWAVRQLLRRPWFSRLWTIQEAVLSRNLFLKCGPASACWDDFAAWCACLEQTGILGWLTGNIDLDRELHDGRQSTLLPPQGASIVNSIQADRLQGLALTQKEYLLNILVSTRYAQATEAKDKVYGVLGIAESTIVPDYSPSLSARDVYHEACLTQIPTFQYELLSCVDHDQPLQPSWVPDWSQARMTNALGYSTKAWALYCAGGRPVTGKEPPRMTLSSDKKAITFTGKVFDSIASLGGVCENPALDIDDPKSANIDLASYVALAIKSRQWQRYLIEGTSVYEAFFWTLLAGRDGSSISAPTQEHSEAFGLILDSTTGQTPSLPGQAMSARRQKGHFTLDNLKTRKPAKTLEDLQTALRAALKMRRFAVTKQGYFALVPRGARIGDEIAVFDRACVPFVIRRTNHDSVQRAFELLGEAYVHGVMKGEVIDMANVEFEDITLI
ncbi:WD repeat-containing protein jip5 [Exserohilum turcicum]